MVAELTWEIPGPIPPPPWHLHELPSAGSPKANHSLVTWPQQPANLGSVVFLSSAMFPSLCTFLMPFSLSNYPPSHLHVCISLLGLLYKNLGGLNNTQLFSHILEAGSPRSRCRQGCFLLRPLSLFCRWLLSCCVIRGPFLCA